MTEPKPAPQEAFAVFVGPIDSAAAQRIVQGLTAAQANGISHVHLLFQSWGGTVGDGVFLYNLFRALPFDLTIYNSGKIESIATIAYLGAKKRKTSAHATFMVHRTNSSPQLATASRLQALTKGMLLDDERTTTILREHLNLTAEQWVLRDSDGDLQLSAADAVTAGLAHEVGDFSPPEGSRLYNI